MSTTDKLLQDYVSIEALADELNVSPRTLDRWQAISAGPPRTRIGRRIFYKRSSVLAWLAKREVA